MYAHKLQYLAYSLGHGRQNTISNLDDAGLKLTLGNQCFVITSGVGKQQMK